MNNAKTQPTLYIHRYRMPDVHTLADNLPSLLAGDTRRVVFDMAAQLIAKESREPSEEEFLTPDDFITDGTDVRELAPPPGTTALMRLAAACEMIRVDRHVPCAILVGDAPFFFASVALPCLDNFFGLPVYEVRSHEFNVASVIGADSILAPQHSARIAVCVRL